MTSGGPPLLLVGHGTRSSAGVAEFLRLVGRVRARGVAPVVAGGFIELAGPSVTEAVAGIGETARPWEVAASTGGAEQAAAAPGGDQTFLLCRYVKTSDRS